MNIYLAGSYGRRKELLRYADELENIGHTVTSRWIRLAYEKKDDAFNKANNRDRLALGQPHAIKDTQDINAADAFVLFAEKNGKPSRGGRHFEMGLAYGLAKQMHVIGHRENVFCCLPDVFFHSSWPDFLVWLGNENEPDDSDGDYSDGKMERVEQLAFDRERCEKAAYQQGFVDGQREAENAK